MTDGDGEVQEENVYVSVEYRSGMDEVNMNLGHQQISGVVMGEALVNSMDCKSCHKVNEVSIGPSYQDISEKYNGQRRATNYLMSKVISGGSGVWGEVVMPAHPDITQSEARQITQYIQSLTESKNSVPSLPLVGSVRPEAKENGEVFLLTASYTDQGTKEVLPLTGSKTVMLASNSMIFPEGTPTKGMQAMTFSGMQLQLFNDAKGWLKIENVDLTGVSMVLGMVGWQTPPTIPYTFELRIGSPDGNVIGTGRLNPENLAGPGTAIPIPIEKTDGMQSEIFLTYKAEGEELGMFALTQLQFNGL